ncbi:MAG: hypothetical protein ACK4SF_11445 [Algoriphagus aquaeductus]|uniref:hypothetical protein n=1 Tax=Algoriphagus aquaeductus TaxID=475299 RepID=UPI00391BE159
MNKGDLFKLRIIPFLLVVWCSFSCVDNGENGSGEIDCSTFAYPDTLFVITPGQTNLVNPLNSLEGEYSASPSGLAINPSTGAIDVNASDTGLKYKISFTPAGTDQTCDFFVTIGGINYLDGVYILSRNETLANPVYNGVVGLPLPCTDDDDEDDDDDDDDDDSSCKFDPDDILKNLGIEVSSKGVIDLKKTVENGTFGSVPVNGTIVDVELLYQLSDLSALAQNRIPLRFFYYAKFSDIPQAVLDDIEEKRKLINEVSTPNSSNFRLSETVRPAGKPRPPYVVIVASFE